MNSGSFYSPALVVVIESGVAGAFGKLLTVDVAEKVVLIGLVLSVFKVFAQNVCHSAIQGDYKRFSVLGNADVNHVIIQIYVLDFYVNQASLSDPRRE